MAQSIAREYGPQGVHVSHVIVDGLIDTEAVGKMAGAAAANTRLKPEAIADAYWSLHTQSLSAFTFETEIRPFAEKW